MIRGADRDRVQQFAFAGFVEPIGRGFVPVLSPCCINGKRSWCVLQLGDIGLECCRLDVFGRADIAQIKLNQRDFGSAGASVDLCIGIVAS